MKLSILSLMLFILATITPRAQESRPLLDAKTRDLLSEALSGELAKEHVIQITRHHRIQGSRGYRSAAQYVLQQLGSFGYSEKEATVESFKSDGKTSYQTWQSPSGWDINSAELRMVEPYGERIVGYPEIAMSLITYSNPGELTAELEWVGTGTTDKDYEGKDVKGKFVLATGYGGEVHRYGVLKYGAKAVVCYLDDDRAREYPDMLQYTGMWPRTEELDRVTFGFNLTKRQGDKLRNLLLAGRKVVLRGWAKGIGLESYFMDIVTARIKGSEFPHEELVFSAHLDHPKESANDNASGSGALLDIARSLKELIDSGRLPRPKRSIRFIWVPEWNGTMAYIDKHPEILGPGLGGNILANMNLDMVGENLELLHSKLIMTRTPASVPSCINDVVENMAQMVDRMNVRTPRGSLAEFNYRLTPYSGGSDHMMFIDRKIPGMMFSHDPDYTHHTSEDTPDKVDPVELERCEIISAAAVVYLASLEPAEAGSLIYLVRGNASRRLGLAARRAYQLITGSAGAGLFTAWLEATNILDHAGQEETSVLSSVLQFSSDANLKELVLSAIGSLTQLKDSYVKDLQALLATRGYYAMDLPFAKPPQDDRVPVRLTRGPLDFGLPGNKLPAADAAWYRSGEFTLDGDMRFELVNFIDGNRTVSHVRNALSAEFSPIELRSVSRYIEDLVKVGVLKWK